MAQADSLEEEGSRMEEAKHMEFHDMSVAGRVLADLLKQATVRSHFPFRCCVLLFAFSCCVVGRSSWSLHGTNELCLPGSCCPATSVRGSGLSAFALQPQETQL